MTVQNSDKYKIKIHNHTIAGLKIIIIYYIVRTN